MHFGFLNPVAAHCTGKAKFDSQKLAVQVSDRWRRHGGAMRAYHCATCGKWHLGSVRKGAPPMSKRRRPPFVEHDGGEAKR